MNQGIRAAAVILLAAYNVGPALAETSGAVTYKAKCTMCHGADGTAATTMGKNLKVLSLKAPEMIKATDAQFIASTKNGKGKMPAYKGKLTDEQIKDVTLYIRVLQK